VPTLACQLHCASRKCIVEALAFSPVEWHIAATISLFCRLLFVLSCDSDFVDSFRASGALEMYGSSRVA
jgi:hypothetical protein